MKKNESFDGSGGKRPLLDIPIKLLELDPLNPRLGEEHKKDSHDELLKVLYEEFDLEEVAFSMSENGYFDEEPIVVVPKNIPKILDLKRYEGKPNELRKQLEEHIQKDEIKFCVIEGNRRVSTAILMTDKKVRESLGVDDDFPKPKNDAVEYDIKIIPAIFYGNRDEVSPYLGVRHISGILKWEAFAKAAYISRRIQEEKKKGNNEEDSIQIIRKKLADRTDVIKKQYMAFKIYLQAEHDLDFNVKVIKDRFSLISEITGSPDIRNYLGVDIYKNVDFSQQIVKKGKLKNLENVLIWVFGDAKNKLPIVTDSRKISKCLSPILADEESTKYLIEYGNLEEAYERSGGEEKYLINKINSARKNIENALRIAYKYKNKNVQEAIQECERALAELNKMVS